MDPETTGMIFTQSGVPVEGSAEYQRVYDTRWKFLEIAYEQEVTVTLPAVFPVDTSARHYERVEFFKHDLGFLPLFETDFPDQRYEYSMLSGASMFANKTHLFFRRFITTQGAEAQTLTFTIRVYNLDVLEEYEAPKGLPLGTSSVRSNIGVKFLEEDKRGVDVSQESDTGFSIDTTKKILSIHKHGLFDLNEFAAKRVSVTAVNTSTEQLTIATVSNPSPKEADTSWTKIRGQAVTYFPSDATSFPAPLELGQTYYIIPVSNTAIKLAASYQGALNNVAINFTSSGLLPAQLSAAATPGANEDAIEHNVGYPPTYMLAQVNTEETYAIGPDSYIGPLIERFGAYTTADGAFLRFRGIQAQLTGRYGYVILKDPAEIAR